MLRRGGPEVKGYSHLFWECLVHYPEEVKVIPIAKKGIESVQYKAPVWRGSARRPDRGATPRVARAIDMSHEAHGQ